MKTSIKLFALGIVLMGFSVNSFAQAPVTAASSATIISPLTIEQAIPLDFGVIAPIAAQSTVTLAIDGSRSGTATVAGLGNGAAGSFTIAGQPSESFSISISAPSNLTDLLGVGDPMTTTGWTSNLGATSNLDESGDATLLVTATLIVGGGQTPGTYNGTYIVTIAYN